MTWSEEAACIGTPDALWFPGRGTAAHAAYATAQWYCNRCPVRRECLQEALDVELPGARYGMRAGLTPAERSAIYNGDRPFPDFPPPLNIHRPEGAAAMTVTDISPKTPQPSGATPSSAEDLIAWGAAHTSSRIQGLAGKVQRALVDLRQEAERQTRVAESEARIARLKAQLANAEQDLAAAKGTKPKASSQPSGEDYAAIRAWARQRGLVVADVGRPARAVIDAYHAAQHAA